MIVHKNDSDNVIKSKLFKLLDFFENSNYIHTFTFEKLCKKQRRLIHVTIAENSDEIYHFTREGKVILSNDDNYSEIYKKYCKLKGINKQTTEKLDSLNEKLIQLNLTAVQQNKLLLEKNSFSSSLSISKETDEIVNSVI